MFLQFLGTSFSPVCEESELQTPIIMSRFSDYLRVHRLFLPSFHRTGLGVYRKSFPTLGVMRTRDLILVYNQFPTYSDM